MSQATRETLLWKDQEKLTTFHRIITALEKTTQEVLTLFKTQINTHPPDYVKLIQVARLVVNVIKSMENNITMAYPVLRHATAKKQLTEGKQLLETQQKLRQEATQQLMQDILKKQLNTVGILNYQTKLNEVEALAKTFNTIVINCSTTLKINIKPSRIEEKSS